MFALKTLAATLLLAVAIADGNNTATVEHTTYTAEESTYQSNGFRWNGLRWNGLRWNGLRWNGVDLHAADADSSVPMSFELNRVSVEINPR